jgi:hypothetical protein
MWSLTLEGSKVATVAITGSYGEAYSFTYPKIEWEPIAGGITISGNTSKGGKPVASKDDVVKALYRLNPTLKNEFETEDEFVEALIAAGQDAHQEFSRSRLSTFSLIEK